QDVKLGKEIGHGSFGTVYVGRDGTSGKLIAVKEILLPALRSGLGEITKKIFEELALLKSLAHHRIVAYLGASTTTRFLHIYMEYVSGGCLKSQLEEFGPIQETVLQSYTRQILEGISYLHSKRVVHCDLKTGNILLDIEGGVKIADFGASIKALPKRQAALSTTAGAAGATGVTKEEIVHIGTPIIWSPEQLAEGGATFESDVWSIGCCVVEML
ncbi:unnamed protein product, partial [Amoebophrya sp. A25]